MARKKIHRNLFKIKLDKSGEFYGYLRTGNYVRQEMADRRGCTNKYRYQTLKNGDRLLFCITKKKGKRGGRTKLLAILRPVNKDLRKYKSKPEVKKALKKARQIKKKLSGGGK